MALLLWLIVGPLPAALLLARLRLPWRPQRALSAATAYAVSVVSGGVLLGQGATLPVVVTAAGVGAPVAWALLVVLWAGFQRFFLQDGLAGVDSAELSPRSRLLFAFLIFFTALLCGGVLGLLAGRLAQAIADGVAATGIVPLTAAERSALTGRLAAGTRLSGIIGLLLGALAPWRRVRDALG